MRENCQRVMVDRDHAIVIAKACRPGPWFASGAAFLAPLYRKRPLLVDRPKWVYAWTLYNEKLGTPGWHISPDSNMSLHLPVDVRSRQPTGWILTIPPALRNKGWLPKCGGTVMYEYDETEANFWTEAAYNEESVLEADIS